MMTYVCSDIHGCLDRYKKLLKEINFNENDTMYILGDVIDRGNDGIEILLDIMKYPNITLIMGNHERMMLDVTEALPDDFGELTVDTIKTLPTSTQDMLACWCGENEGLATLRAFLRLSDEEKYELSDYLCFLPLYWELSVNKKNYVLVHGGLGMDFSSDRELVEYDEDSLLWSRTDYERTYYTDRILITGHTPTQYIAANSRPSYIFIGSNNFALDCGCGFDGGQLGCICLETMEEFYIK